MKALGLTLMLAGYLWVLLDIVAFTPQQYRHWIAQTARLPETVRRNEASGAMRDISLELNGRHKLFILPATIMLIGGLIAAFAPSKPRDQKSLQA